MKKNELLALKDQLQQLATTVGAYQVENLGRKDLIINSKSSAVDLVTEVDKKSEEMIIAFIEENYPDHAILAEESGMTNKESDYMWVIDPVDGTTNYAHGYPLFAISIGLSFKGDIILGTIYMPYMKDFFWAIKGHGAFLGNEPITVSSNKTLEASIIATGFPYNKKTSVHNNLDYFAEVMPNVCGIRRSGSACVDLVNIASGRIDGYFEMYLNPWDYLPGQLLVREAGGICEVRLVREKYSIIATNPYIRKELTDRIFSVGQDDY